MVIYMVRQEAWSRAFPYRPRKEPTPPTHWFWMSSRQNCWSINFSLQYFVRAALTNLYYICNSSNLKSLTTNCYLCFFFWLNLPDLGERQPPWCTCSSWSDATRPPSSQTPRTRTPCSSWSASLRASSSGHQTSSSCTRTTSFRTTERHWESVASPAREHDLRPQPLWG